MRLLLDAEIEAHGCLNSEQEKIHLKIPEENIELVLSNLEVSPGTDRPLMAVQLVFETESFDTGLEHGKRILQEILNSLSYVTSLHYQFYRSRRLIDWSDSSFEREYYAYQGFPGHDLPYEILNSELLESAIAIWKASKNEELKLAVHWFASGVASKVIEDQFQLFWFSAELIATHNKSPKKVNDLCPNCRKKLYCENCKKHPEHKPYDKQAIEQMFKFFIREDFDVISKKLFKTRNMLLHGSSREQVENQIGCELAVCVEDLARIVKLALLHVLNNDLAKLLGDKEISLIDIEGYAHTVLNMHLRMQSSPIPPDIEQIDKLALPTMSMSVNKKKE